MTPPAPDATDTYLFIGDSFIFGQGLRDDETMPSQFTKLNAPAARSVNLGVPGYGPNHLVRAFEAGLLDRYAGQRVKAVVTWIIPAHLARVTGDEEHMGDNRLIDMSGKRAASRLPPSHKDAPAGAGKAARQALKKAPARKAAKKVAKRPAKKVAKKATRKK